MSINRAEARRPVPSQFDSSLKMKMAPSPLAYTGASPRPQATRPTIIAIAIVSLMQRPGAIHVPFGARAGWLLTRRGAAQLGTAVPTAAHRLLYALAVT